MKKDISFDSICIHDIKGQETTTPHMLPLYPTSSFEFDSITQGINIFSGKEKGHVYGRYANPTIDAVSDKIASLEAYGLGMEASAIMVSSGMAAISTLFMALLKSGDKVLTQGNLYGGTTEWLTKVLQPLGVEVVMSNLKKIEEAESLLRRDPAFKLVYFETPANPSMAIADIEALSSLAHQYDCYSAIDNTFCTPYIQQPFKFGADFIIHSTTKFLNGHGNSIAGAIVGKDLELMQNKVWSCMKLTGTNCSPWEAWLVNNGLKTLTLRMDRHSENAMAVAQFLEQHPKVKKVNYNGLLSHPDHELAKKQMTQFGGMLSFELKGGLKAGIRFMEKIEFCTLAPTLGDVDTLVLHPASSSHVNIPKEVRIKNEITDGLVRLSVGIEAKEDIIGDLEQALG